MKKYIQGMAMLFIALLSINTVFAQNPRLKAPLIVVDNGLTFTITYDISGLGNVSETQMELKYDVSVTTDCYNKGQDAGPVPGQTKTYTGEDEKFTVEVHNGRAKGSYTTTKEYPAGECPNGFKTGVVSDATFTNISLTVAGQTFYY